MDFERERVAEALPGYDVGEELGRGAWGIVLRGEHRRLRRPVAIKQLPRTFATDPAVQRRLDVWLWHPRPGPQRAARRRRARRRGVVVGSRDARPPAEARYRS